MISKVSKVFDYSAIASGIVLFLLAVLTFCDVFGRRFLNSPVTGTIELVEIGMALVAFLAMPRAFYLNANVSADFINNLNLGVFKTYLVVLKFILMIGIMSLMAYATTITSFKFMANKQRFCTYTCCCGSGLTSCLATTYNYYVIIIFRHS